MVLDDRALVTLEVLEGSLGGQAGSLLAALDRAASQGGRRTVRSWLCRRGPEAQDLSPTYAMQLAKGP